MLKPRTRHGFTLAEIVVTLVLGAIVLGLVSSIGSRLQRRLAVESEHVVARDQLASAAEVLPIDLRGLSPGDGDIAPGEARDSSIQIRATLANAIVCGGSPSTLTLATYLAAGGRFIAPSVQDGDTAWLLSATDTSDVWLPVRLRGVHRATTACSFADANASRVFDVAHPWAADLRDSILVLSRTVMRITRPLRFSFYRAADSRWYLGLRTWNGASRQFNTIQPISGPFAPAGDRGTRFEYFDALGNHVSSGALDTRAIARLEGVLVTDASAGVAAAVRESVVVVVALRNRR
ncbi:MAG TPA: prepilin-type N-terminal cleavage/methylation domain-containing protein [Gemmatimonadaceae bacterium]|nr:prepilin-type N-terminal cleavage/methylation domain-containing protein [Gemmatimonadaceae bacterium]